MDDTLIMMVLALVLLGPRRLPQVGRQIGKLMYEFRKASNDFKYQLEEELRNAEEADKRQREEAERQRALTDAQNAVAQAQSAAETALQAAAQAQNAAQAAQTAAAGSATAAESMVAETAYPSAPDFTYGGSETTVAAEMAPVASELVAAEPVAAEPAVSELVAAEPVAAEPVAAEPVAAEPVETGLRIQPPATGEPVAYQRPGRPATEPLESLPIQSPQMPAPHPPQFPQKKPS